MGETRTCPHCGQQIKAKAILCKHCNQRLDQTEPIPESAPAPPSTAPAQAVVAPQPQPAEPAREEPAAHPGASPGDTGATDTASASSVDFQILGSDVDLLRRYLDKNQSDMATLLDVSVNRINRAEAAPDELVSNSLAAIIAEKIPDVEAVLFRMRRAVPRAARTGATAPSAPPLTAPHEPSVKPPTRPSQWFGAVMLMLLAVGVLFLGFKTGRMARAIQYWVLFSVGTSIWVLADAYAVGARKGLMSGMLDLSPGGWFFASWFMWPIGYLVYIGAREGIRQRARLEKVTQFACPQCGGNAPPMQRHEEAHFCTGCHQWWTAAQKR